MKEGIRNRGWKIVAGYLAAMVVICAAAMSLAQEAQITVIGEINDTYQLVASKKIYDIAETPAGDDLARNYISQKVRVTGTLLPGEEIDTIRVHAFEVVDE